MTSQFAAALSERLKAKDMDIRQLSKRIDSSYEYCRKFVRGLAYPSKHLLRQICGALQLDEEKMQALLISDRLTKKYGEIPEALTGKNPRYSELEPRLSLLSQDQFEIVVGMVELLIGRNRLPDTDLVKAMFSNADVMVSAGPSQAEK